MSDASRKEQAFLFLEEGQLLWIHGLTNQWGLTTNFSRFVALDSTIPADISITELNKRMQKENSLIFTTTNNAYFFPFLWLNHNRNLDREKIQVM